MTQDVADGSTQGRVRAERGVLTRLVGCYPDEFADRFWGRRHLLSTADQLGTDRDGFADLLDLDAVDELVSRRGLRAPFLRVAKDGTTLPERSYTAGGGVGAAVGDQLSDDKLLQLFGEGATLVLQGLHRMWPPLIDFGQGLAADLGHPVQVNAYVTPPQSRGFSDHYDVHDVFVLQAHGQKRWVVHEPVLPAPLRDQPWEQRKPAVEETARTPPALEVTLRPGDCLYLPRGYIHGATALGGVSAHLTVGVHSWTRHGLADELLRAALRRAGQEAAMRGSLPLGVDVGDEADLDGEVDDVRERLIRALRDVPAEDISTALAARARDAQRAAPVAPVAQLQAAGDIDRDTVLQLRPHLLARTSTADDGTVLLDSRAGRLQVPAAEAAGVPRLLEGVAVAVGDLPLEPGAALGLAGRLLRAGIVTPA